MGKGFVPEGDKLHQMQPQRPGAFIAITETGVIMEVIALMETKQVMVREWETVPWDDATVETETARVQSELQRVQMQGHGGPQPPAPRAPSGLIKPSQIAKAGTI